MATKLGKPVTREVPVKDADGCDGVVSVTITADGVTMRGKGTQRELVVSFSDLAEFAEAPEQMPRKFENNKLGWLINRHQVGNSATKLPTPSPVPVE